MQSSSILNLDRPRQLRFGYKALKMVTKLVSEDLNNLSLTNINGGYNFEVIEKLVYVGLLSDARENGENITFEQIEDLLDQADSFIDIADTLTVAWLETFGTQPDNVGDVEGNEQGE